MEYNVTAAVTGLPASRAFEVIWDGTAVASLTSDSSGAAAVTFTVANSQRLGTFPLQLSVGGTVVANSSGIQVAQLLAATGPDTTGGVLLAGALVALGVIALIGSATLRRRSVG